jgi:hypothetical protein
MPLSVRCLKISWDIIEVRHGKSSFWNALSLSNVCVAALEDLQITAAIREAEWIFLSTPVRMSSSARGFALFRGFACYLVSHFAFAWEATLTPSLDLNLARVGLGLGFRVARGHLFALWSRSGMKYPGPRSLRLPELRASSFPRS